MGPAMLSNPSAGREARRAAGERAYRYFRDAGFARVEPAILQPTAPFLDMSGEDIRGRLFLTSGPEGEELCLRPDFTIPVCLMHLTQGGGREARYAYLGPVFRSRAGSSANSCRRGSKASVGAISKRRMRKFWARAGGGRRGRGRAAEGQDRRRRRVRWRDLGFGAAGILAPPGASRRRARPAAGKGAGPGRADAVLQGGRARGAGARRP